MNAELDLSGLRGSLAGDVLAPEDSGYDGARRCYNALIDRRPAVIARCLGAGDIAAAFGERTFDRLQELKRRYDPDNVLHRNQNIPPA